MFCRGPVRSTDGVSWGQLPAPTEADIATAAKLPNGLPFAGDISHTYTLPAEPTPEGGARTVSYTHLTLPTKA